METKLRILLEAPRGLSAEEKRVKILEIFHESVSRDQFETAGGLELTNQPSKRDFYQVGL